MNNKNSQFSFVRASFIGLLFVSHGFASPNTEFIASQMENIDRDPLGRNLNTDEDWHKGAALAAPPWTGYPSSETKEFKTAGILGRIFEHEMAATSQAPDFDGFQPRNIALNRQLDSRHARREAMPTGLAHPSLSLFLNPDGSGNLRPAVEEWINTRYRKDLSIKLHGSWAQNFVATKGISYRNIWFDNPHSPFNYDLTFDELGRPLNPSPYAEEIGVAGHGFYFRLGQNIAADVLVSFEHEGKFYAIMNVTNGEDSLAFPAGMVDINDVSRIQTAFRELSEETGIFLDLPKLDKDKRVHLVWAGTVAGETRQTRNAWTDSNLFHVHFASLGDFSSYITKINHEFDKAEIAKRYILDLAFVIENYLLPGGTKVMRASHKSMLGFALGKFFHEHPTKLSLIDTQPGTNINASRLKFAELRALVAGPAAAQ